MDDSSLLERNAVSLDEYCLIFREKTLPSHIGSNSPRRPTLWKDRVHYIGVGGERTLWEARQ